MQKVKQKPAKPGLWKPLIGMAICVCLFVVALLVGVVGLCGPMALGHGPPAAFSDAANTVIVLLFWSPVAGFAGCVVWLLVAAARNALTDD